MTLLCLGRYGICIGGKYRNDLRDKPIGTGQQVGSRGAIWKFLCCVILHFLVLQNEKKMYNASVCDGRKSDFRDKATETRKQVGPRGCQLEAPMLCLPLSSCPPK